MIYIVVYFYLAPFIIFILNWYFTFFVSNGFSSVVTVSGIGGWDN